MTSSPLPLRMAFTMYSVKPFAISTVIEGGIASSVRLTTASTKTGPSWASAAAIPPSTSSGFCREITRRLLHLHGFNHSCARQHGPGSLKSDPTVKGNAAQISSGCGRYFRRR